MKKLVLSVLSLLPMLYAMEASPIKSFEVEANKVRLLNELGETMGIHVFTDDIIRIQQTKGAAFKESAMIKYGFVYDDFPQIDYKVEELDGTKYLGLTP